MLNRVVCSLTCALCMSVCVGCTRQVAFTDVEPPALWWQVRQGLCGHNYALDANGDLWTEGGCETGPVELRHRRKLEPTEIARLTQRFAALPATPPPFERCTKTEHRFVQASAGGEKSWSVCVASDAWNPATLPPPYRAVLAAFVEIARAD